MPLFGGKSDINIFKHFNDELINRIVEIYVDIYKIDLSETTSNIYGESETRKYRTPLRIASLISQDSQSSDLSEFGKSTNQTSTFSFLRDELIEKDMYVQEGDVIHWNNKYWEIDHIMEDQLFIGRNPQTNKSISDEWGWSISVICEAHVSTKIKII